MRPTHPLTTHGHRGVLQQSSEQPTQRVSQACQLYLLCGHPPIRDCPDRYTKGWRIGTGSFYFAKGNSLLSLLTVGVFRASVTVKTRGRRMTESPCKGSWAEPHNPPPQENRTS